MASRTPVSTCQGVRQAPVTTSARGSRPAPLARSPSLRLRLCSPYLGLSLPCVLRVSVSLLSRSYLAPISLLG
eukprot:scaffold24129_cov48-Phaeocystis_antarctica.AAC.1